MLSEATIYGGMSENSMPDLHAWCDVSASYASHIILLPEWTTAMYHNKPENPDLCDRVYAMVFACQRTYMARYTDVCRTLSGTRNNGNTAGKVCTATEPDANNLGQTACLTNPILREACCLANEARLGEHRWHHDNNEAFDSATDMRRRGRV